MARSLGIQTGLNESHWKIIRYLRDMFLNENTVPVVVTACAQNRMRLAELRSLFPTGYHRGACRIAGINYRFMVQTNYWLTYETGPPVKSRYPLDSLGFLEEYDRWDSDFTDFIIAELKMEIPGGLTEMHRKVLQYLRDYYETYQNIPTIYETCSATSFGLEDLKELFPMGYRRGACRIAGLPFYA
jgi:tRNA 2-thiouridine synthesizing protein E